MVTFPEYAELKMLVSVNITAVPVQAVEIGSSARVKLIHPTWEELRTNFP
jgi:hypothetical protein